MLTPFVKLRTGTQLFSIGHCTFLSVKLTQNGRETIQSVKVAVHQREASCLNFIKTLSLKSCFCLAKNRTVLSVTKVRLQKCFRLSDLRYL